MENLGALAILLAFCLAIYAAAGSITGKLKGNPFLIVSAERAVYGTWFLITLAAGVLVSALLTGDFRFVYVAEESNRAMPAIYKFTAWWGGQAGSVLLWSWLLSTYAAVVVFTNRRRHRGSHRAAVGFWYRGGLSGRWQSHVDRTEGHVGPEYRRRANAVDRPGAASGHLFTQHAVQENGDDELCSRGRRHHQSHGRRSRARIQLQRIQSGQRGRAVVSVRDARSLRNERALRHRGRRTLDAR